jgi:hypothetical protein
MLSIAGKSMNLFLLSSTYVLKSELNFFKKNWIRRKTECRKSLYKSRFKTLQGTLGHHEIEKIFKKFS